MGETRFKGNFTVFVKDQKDKYINAEALIKGNIFVVDANGVSVIYPLKNITKIIYSSSEEK